MNVYNMELQELISVVGNGVLLPWVQIYLNKYVPKKYRSLSVLVLSILAGVIWGVVYAGNLESFLANTAIVITTSQTVYFKILKDEKNSKGKK